MHMKTIKSFLQKLKDSRTSATIVQLAPPGTGSSDPVLLGDCRIPLVGYTKSQIMREFNRTFYNRDV